ncbi:MAG TPA: tetratricopeptide repeat protein [Bacteroidetes bacterium]|nr:tetratricopeptide repeat protein [Bacteroidota bacterium]
MNNHLPKVKCFCGSCRMCSFPGSMLLLLPGVFFFFALLVVLPLSAGAQSAALEEARGLAMSGRHEAAEQKLYELLDQHPGYLPARLLLAHNYSWHRQFDLAISHFKEILDDDPNNHDALVGLGYAYAWSGQTPKAIFPFNKALHNHRGDPEARKGLGHTYLIAGNGQAAAYVFEKLTEDFPEVTEYWTALAQAYALSGETKKARKALQSALAIAPADPLANELSGRIRAEASKIEVDVWGGYSNVGNNGRFGLRILQASWQFDPRFTVYARYDNTLSLDNVDFVARRSQVPAVWAGGFAGWNSRLASRLEYGVRFLSTGQPQHLIKAEQVLFGPKAFNIRIGGLASLPGRLPTEWLGYTSFYLPLNKVFSIEPTYYYARQAGQPGAAHRLLLSGKLRHPKGFELTLGGFYEKPNVNVENVKNNVKGGYAIALIPISKMIRGQLAVNFEDGIFNRSAVFAAGVKVGIRN